MVHQPGSSQFTLLWHRRLQHLPGLQTSGKTTRLSLKGRQQLLQPTPFVSLHSSHLLPLHTSPPPLWHKWRRWRSLMLAVMLRHLLLRNNIQAGKSVSTIIITFMLWTGDMCGAGIFISISSMISVLLMINMCDPDDNFYPDLWLNIFLSLNRKNWCLISHPL